MPMVGKSCTSLRDLRTTRIIPKCSSNFRMSRTLCFKRCRQLGGGWGIVSKRKFARFSTVTGDYDGDGFVDFVSHQVGPHPEVRRSIPNGNAGMRILCTEPRAMPMQSAPKLSCGQARIIGTERRTVEKATWRRTAVGNTLAWRATQPWIPSRSSGLWAPWKLGMTFRYKLLWN